MLLKRKGVRRQALGGTREMVGREVPVDGDRSQRNKVPGYSGPEGRKNLAQGSRGCEIIDLRNTSVNINQ